MKNLFLVYSTYHILLSYAIALENKSDKNILIVCEDTEEIKKFVDLLQQIFPSQNIQIRYLASTRKMNNIKAYFVKKRNLKRIGEIVKACGEVDKFFYSCEWKVYTTYASYLLRQQVVKPSCFYIDDGAATYMQRAQKLKTKNFIEKLGDTIAYGAWHHSFERQGELNQNTTICSIFPELLPSFYDGQGKFQVSVAPLFASMDKKKFQNLLAEIFQGNAPDVLIALDDATRCTEGYLSSIKQAIGGVVGEDCRVAIKRHPVDVGNTNLTEKLELFGDFDDLPIHLPIELYYLYFSESLKVVVGGFSTAIITARWLVPQAKVVCTFDARSLETVENSQLLLEVFKSLGVEINCID